jgi:hypothetical protein
MNAPEQFVRQKEECYPLLIYTGNFSIWGSPPFRLDSLTYDRLRYACKLVEVVRGISWKSAAAVAENRKGQKTPGKPPRSGSVQLAKFFPHPFHLVASFAFCQSTSASKPFKRFLEVLIATIGTRRSRDRESICGALSREPGLRGCGSAPDRLSGQEFVHPRFRLSCLGRSRRIFKIEPETGQCGTISPRSGELPITFAGVSFNVLDFAPETAISSMRLRTKDRYPCPQVGLRPRLLAVTISTHR